jgi:hypothetical protein
LVASSLAVLHDSPKFFWYSSRTCDARNERNNKCENRAKQRNTTILEGKPDRIILVEHATGAWYLDEDGVGAPVGVMVVGEHDGAEAVGVVAMHLVLCVRPDRLRTREGSGDQARSRIGVPLC